jgi:large subunit ribosomal protein L24
MRSIKPSKQRKTIYNAPLHKRRKWVSSHLEENLLLKYDKRAIPVIKGDTVKVMRGSFRGHEDKIAKVNVKKRYLEIEGITMSKADGNKIAKPIHPSNVMITKLNLTDKWRRSKLERGLSEETKKEIEKEAEEQVKEAEEIKKQEELEKEKAELEAEEEEPPVEEKEEKTDKKEEPKEKKTPAKKTTKKKVEKKTGEKQKPKTTKKKTQPKSTKKTTSKKTETKKTPAKKKDTKKATKAKSKEEK